MMLPKCCYFLAMISQVSARYVMYLTGQHNLVPEPELVSQITHVALAFMPSSIFNTANPLSFPLFTTVEKVRSQFASGTAIMVAIGGWGDTAGFSEAAESEASRERFARNVKRMIEVTGADGVDIDWEYPGGNGEDYLLNPNPTKSHELQTYPLLLSTLRSHLPPPTLISAAVPGLPRDMLAFTSTTIPLLSPSLDFLNIMTYDLMNRRDNITKHHTGIQISLQSIDAYISAGLEPAKMNLGFAFYVKWFKTSPSPSDRKECERNPIGCRTALMEDPSTGADLGQAGAFSWHDAVPEELSTSFSKALERGVYDDVGGGYYFWDGDEDLWWSWETEEGMRGKFERVLGERGVGGVFAWGLGEDALEWRHLRALNEGYRGWAGGWERDKSGKGREGVGKTEL